MPAVELIDSIMLKIKAGGSGKQKVCRGSMTTIPAWIGRVHGAVKVRVVTICLVPTAEIIVMGLGALIKIDCFWFECDIFERVKEQSDSHLQILDKRHDNDKDSLMLLLVLLHALHDPLAMHFCILLPYRMRVVSRVVKEMHLFCKE